MNKGSHPPRPLSETPPARLSWRDDGVPVAQDFDDIYFSTDGGLEEAKNVFLKACNLPKSWQGKKLFSICELGFGSGLNFLATLKLWQENAHAEQILHFISIEAFPFDKEQLTRALAGFNTLSAQASALIEIWPGRVKGTHRLNFGTVILTLIHDDIAPALVGLDAKIDAWFLDGFAPAKNPEMWSENVFSHMARLSNLRAKVGTFTVAGTVRRGLAKAGFTVTKQKGFGRKRERLEAIYAPKQNPNTRQIPTSPPIIIGAGIAGASIAHAYIKRGITPILIDPETDTAASGNPAGILMPKLDIQDRPESRFYNAAYLYARTLYINQGHVFSQGVLQMDNLPKDKERFEKIAKAKALPLDDMCLIDAQKARGLSHVAIANDKTGLYFARALIISPKRTVKSLCQGAKRIKLAVAKIEKQGNDWLVFDTSAQQIARSKTVFVCNGANILGLVDMDVRFTKGQIVWGDTASLPQCGIICKNYAAPFDGQLVLGASHAHTKPGENATISKQETLDILQAWQAMGGDKLNPDRIKARAAKRVTTKNTLPIASFDNRLGILSGLGSRGFLLAPLLGEHLACKALGEPCPLDKPTQERFKIKTRNKA